MNNKFYKKFEDFLSNFNLTNEQYGTIFSLFDKIEKKDENDLLQYIELSNSLDNYNYDEFKEELEDIVGLDNNELNKEEKIDDDLEDEEIDIVDEKANNLRDLISKNQTNEEKEEMDLEDEEIEAIEENQDSQEEIEIVDLDLEDEEINVLPTKKTGRIFNFFKNLFNKKQEKEDLPLEKEEIEKVDLEDEQIEEIKENKSSKIDEIKLFVYKNNLDNHEILDFINLIEYREDKEIIINSLYDFINKLYELFSMKKKEEEKKEIIVVEPKQEEKVIEVKNNKIIELSDYEKQIIDDLKADNIDVNDAEFNQFMSERAVNKNMIKSYLTGEIVETKKEIVKETKPEIINENKIEKKEIVKNTNVIRKEKNIQAARENKHYYITIYDAASTIVKKHLETVKPTTKEEKQKEIEIALNKFYTQITNGLSKQNHITQNRVKIDYELEKIREQEKQITLIEKSNKLSDKVSMYAKQLPNLENKLDNALAKYNDVLKNAPKRSEYSDDKDGKKEFNKDYSKYESLVVTKPKEEYEKALNEYKKIIDRMANASKTIINISETTSKTSKEEALDNIDKHMDIIIALGYKGKDFNEMKQNAQENAKVLS